MNVILAKNSVFFLSVELILLTAYYQKGVREGVRSVERKRAMSCLILNFGCCCRA
jgi:hypothetical protein